MTEPCQDGRVIHWFSVATYRSVRDDVTLDFRIPGTTPAMSCFRRSGSKPETRLPTVVAFIGPNGAGKTTLLRAMTETIDFAANSYFHPSFDLKAAFPPFLDPEMRDRSTRIEMEFDAPWFGMDDSTASLCRYVVEIDRSRDPWNVGYEALFVHPKGRPKRLLERRQGKPVYVARELRLRQSDERLSSIPPNASAISALGRMEVRPFARMAQDLQGVRTNIVRNYPDPWRPDSDVVTQHYRDNPALISRVSDRVQRFDLGIEKMQILQAQDAKWHLWFKHNGLDALVHLVDESAGTRHLVTAFPQLNFVLETGGIAVMDSLDSDFHTDLMAEILDWFRREDTNSRNAQLICSLHNVSLLDGLEKEEVFVAEKALTGATDAYGLRDVAGLRRGADLHKSYRGGSLGGRPIFG